LVSKTKDFSKNLKSLQTDNEKKKEIIASLKRELRSLKQEALIVEERLTRDLKEKFSRDFEERLSKVKDESYCKGRLEGSDEMALENNKLREIIESLRTEVSTKGKRLIEIQFEMEELSRGKRRHQAEAEELSQKLAKEREGQRQLQTRLDTLLQEVSYLKNLSRQMQ